MRIYSGTVYFLHSTESGQSLLAFIINILNMLFLRIECIDIFYPQ